MQSWHLFHLLCLRIFFFTVLETFYHRWTPTFTDQNNFMGVKHCGHTKLRVPTFFSQGHTHIFTASDYLNRRCATLVAFAKPQARFPAHFLQQFVTNVFGPDSRLCRLLVSENNEGNNEGMFGMINNPPVRALANISETDPIQNIPANITPPPPPHDLNLTPSCSQH